MNKANVVASAVLGSKLFAAPLLLLVCGMFAPGPVFALDILVGSSRATTFNHHIGRTLCRLINSRSQELDCGVVPAREHIHSTDQVHTLTNVANGAVDVGIVDSATQHDAVNRAGFAEFFDIRFDNIRSLFSLNGVPFTVIARDDARVETFGDIKGKRVNVGNPGSAQREIMDALMVNSGWGSKDLMLMEELPAAQSQDALALCFGSVDAVVRFEVHPNPATRHMLKMCDARLIQVTGPAVDRLIRERPFYASLSIPAHTYASQDSAVSTFGLMQTVVATTELDDDTAYMLVRLVFEDLEGFRRSHPAFRELGPEDMHARGLSAPLHPGALRYYQERGWSP